MHKTYFSLIAFAFLATLSFTASEALAEAAVLPPPTDVHKTDEVRETINDDASETDLNRDLAPPENIEGAEVRSYERKDGSEVTEYSVKGKVYMVRVQPAGNLPAYYLYDNDGDGLFERRLPGGYKRPSPPMWIIKKY
jgi:hypothetical protein